MKIEHSNAMADSEEAKKRAQQIYYATCWVVGFGFLAATAFLVPDTALLPIWLFLLLGVADVFLLLVQAAGAYACRRAGVSQEKSSTEVIYRDARAALAPHLREAPEFDLAGDAWLRRRVDREGIRLSKKQQVLWSDVESCTAHVDRDAIGRTTASLTLQGRDEKLLLRLSVNGCDAVRLLPAIRFYLRAEVREAGGEARQPSAL